MSAPATANKTTVLRTERVSDLLAGLDTLTFENTIPDRRLSIYLPHGRDSEDSRESRRFLECRLAEIERRHRTEAGDVDPEMRQPLEALKDLAAHFDARQEFREDLPGGLAIFAGYHGIRLFEVARDFEPRFYFSHHWHLTPLLELAANVDCYWLLALSGKTLNLYRGSRLGICRINLSDTSLSFTENESFGPSSTDKKTDLPLLKAAAEDHETLDRLLTELDRKVAAETLGSTAPLILAGEPEFTSRFRKICSHDHLVRPELSVNDYQPATALDELHSRASEALKHEFLRSRKRELLKIRDLSTSGLVETRIAKILDSALVGRVAALVAPSDTVFWGRYDPETGKVVELPSTDCGGRDLYQQAAEETLFHGGRLFYLDSVKMPEGWPLCAELRY